jgi:hypothetical protein
LVRTAAGRLISLPGRQLADAVIVAVAGRTMRGANIVVDREEGCQLMVEVGDRIRLSSMKGPDREGVVTAVTGSLVRVRWPSGDETTVAPAAGTLSVLAGGKAVLPDVAEKRAAKKTGSATKKAKASKIAPPKKSGARKPKGA